MSEVTCQSVIRIALPVPMRRLFDYLPPEGMQASDAVPGCRIAVNFANQQLIGIVIGHSDHTDVPANKLKAATELLDSAPILDAETLKLCQWLSTYYHHPLGEVLDLAIPVMLRRGAGLEEAQEQHWRAINSEALNTEQPEGLRSQKQLALWQLFRQQPVWAHKALTRQGYSKAQITRFEELGLVESFQRLPEPLALEVSAGEVATHKLPLNHEQAKALNGIAKHFDSFHVALLEGVTGSGKTEVYLQLIEQALEQGKQVLLMVPEIGLTPQTLRRFQARFSVPVVTLHSNLNDRERLVAWSQCRLHKDDPQQARILIGTRSSIFTPMPDLGLIIIDEEHDASFKQQDGLRYSARDFAIKRAQQKQVPVVLGSATPALETLHNAYSRRFSHYKLTQRAGNAKPPRLKLHSILHQPLEMGLAYPVIDKMQQHLNEGQQVMVFINRRGFAPTLACRDCGWMAECRRCDARMTLHQSPYHLHCHHCDNQAAVPRMCPNCNSLQVEPVGQGTERLEENIQQLFPATEIKRVDRDTVRSKDAFDQLLDDIHKGEPCILVGTQMLAKGHHFPNVTMVVILDADSGLFSADFRGMEKTAQLLMQVAGRAGRGDKPGEVWIQTLYADHPQLNLLIQGGYHNLAASILQERKGIQLPPYSFMALLRSECSDKNLAEQLQQNAREFIQSWLNQYWQQTGADTTAITLIGPFPAPMERRAGRFRQQMQIMSAERNSLHRVLDALVHFLENQRGFHKVRWSLDIDPLDLS